MYVDVIIPNFDESGEEVLISTWYKKVGDKIAKGEVIAESETSTIACGITSGYDCFLSKIIAKEGDIVPQGSKVAVIEVDVEKPTPLSTENLRETIKEELKNIHVSPDTENEQKEIQEQKTDVANLVQDKNEVSTEQESIAREAAAASRAERRQALRDMEDGKISADEIEKMRAQREAEQNTRKVPQNEVKKEETAEKEPEEYTLSVSSDNQSNDLVAETIDDIIDEENDLMDENLILDKTLGKEVEKEEETKDSSEGKKSIVTSFTEQAEKEFRSILKDAELRAQNEANKLREKIIEDARVSALAESEVMKAKILKEYEDRASKDAGKMHKKIVQGSISEAQNTRAKLIEEAKAEAINEANEIKSKMKKEAQEEAEKEANFIKQNSLIYAEKQAKTEADKISREIIEKAIEEAKAEANEIKKDIIRSAGKHAKKESEQLIKEELRHARKKSQLKAEEIISSAIIESKICADEIREEVINKTKASVKEVMDNLMQSVLAESQQEVKQSSDLKAKIAESMKESIDQVINTKEKIMDEINQNRENAMKEMNESKDQMIGGIKESIDQVMDTKNKIMDEINQNRENTMKEINESKDQTIGGIKESIDQAVKLKEKLTEEIKDHLDEATKVKEKLSEKIKENINQDLHLKNEILEEMKHHYDKVCEDISDHIRKTVDEVKNEILVNADKKIQEIQNSCQTRDITGEIIEERINAKQNEIVEKLQELKDIQEKNAKQEVKTTEQCVNQELQKDLQNPNMDKEISKKKTDEKEDDFVKKLLNIEEDNGGTPEMYANNWRKPKFFYSPDDQRENIDFLRQRISERMKDAYDSSVIATISNEVDMSSIISLEKAFGEAFSKKYNTRLGFTPFFIMAAVETLKRYKVFNAHVHEDEIIYKNHFDISVITCGNDGISAPVIREADKLNFAEIEKKMITLSRRAVEGTLSLEEVSNGTFTVVNAGMYGSLMGTDILTPPQVATLSVHKMHNRPVATDEGVEIKPMLYISLSYDHRVADTKLAAEFLSNVKNYVENPGWQLLGL